jgi:RNA recognition motif-containing protein
MAGRTVSVKPHAYVKKAREPMGSRALFVGNVPFDVTKEELAEVFKSCGRILCVRLPYDSETAQPRGFAFVYFQVRLIDSLVLILVLFVVV